MHKTSVLLLALLCLTGCTDPEKVADRKAKQQRLNQAVQEDLASSWGGTKKTLTKDQKQAAAKNRKKKNKKKKPQ